MWIRFWSKANDSSSLSEEESHYVWVNPETDEECLQDQARELVPNWMLGCQSGFKYGAERIDKLPNAEVIAQLKRQERVIVNAAKMVDLLLKELTRVGKCATQPEETK